MMEIYSRALSVLRYPWSLGCRNKKMRKENKSGNEVTCMVDKLFVHGDAINLTSGVCDISRSNRNISLKLEVHSNIYSCGYRGQYGCPRLRCSSLIGRGSGSCLYFTEPIGSHAYGSSICWILDRESERKSPEKFRTPERFRAAEKFRRERLLEKVLWSEVYYYCSLVDYAIHVSRHETWKLLWMWLVRDHCWKLECWLTYLQQQEQIEFVKVFLYHFQFINWIAWGQAKV